MAAGDGGRFAGCATASKAKKATAANEFSAASLSPTFPPPSKRDPFFLPGAARTAKARSGRSGAGGVDAVKAAEIKGSDLVLAATCIVGNQRMAMINGKIYREKDVIRGTGDEAPSYIVTEILPHKVLLSSQGEFVQLSYANAAAKPAAGKNARKGL